MTFARLLMVWGLRGLVLWGAAELGIVGFNEVTHEREALDEVSGHAAAMERLQHRAVEAERAATAMEQELVLRRKTAAILTLNTITDPGSGLSEVIRHDLVALGAQTPQVATTLTPIAGGLKHAAISAQWSEFEPTAPSLLAALAIKRPDLSVTRLAIERTDGSPPIKTTAEFQLTIQVKREAAR
jgi:hypothetical protein